MPTIPCHHHKNEKGCIILNDLKARKLRARRSFVPTVSSDNGRPAIPIKLCFGQSQKEKETGGTRKVVWRGSTHLHKETRPVRLAWIGAIVVRSHVVIHGIGEVPKANLEMEAFGNFEVK